ncbi:MAG: BspA family leucine-rich repeat surface protein [Succinivibrio sp.]
MAGLKGKQASEFFLELQKAFLMDPQRNTEYEVRQDDGGSLEVSMSIRAAHDFSKLSSKTRSKIPSLPKPAEKTLLGVVRLKVSRKGGGLELKTSDTKFQCDPRYQVFDGSSAELLAILCRRVVNYNRLRTICRKALGLGEDAPFTIIPKDTLELRVIISSAGCSLGDIDVSGLNDLSYAFATYTDRKVAENRRSDFEGIEKWDTSHVENMLGCFAGCVNFNKDISMWDFSKVRNASMMFASCRKFNQDLSKWDTSSLENIKGMFYRCDEFDQDLSAWNTSKVSDMSYAFYRAKSYSHDLSMWDTSSVKDDENMFLECPLDPSRHPKLPSEDFKLRYYEKYVAKKPAAARRLDFRKKIIIALAFIMVAMVFALMNQQPPQG